MLEEIEYYSNWDSGQDLNVCFPNALFYFVNVLLLTIFYLGQCGSLRLWQTTFFPESQWLTHSLIANEVLGFSGFEFLMSNML